MHKRSLFFKGFIAAHTLPVLYEKYDDQIDGFVCDIIGQLQNKYRKLDVSVLSKLSKGNYNGKKYE